MKKIAVVYDSFPHYRSGVIKHLNESNKFSYCFFGSVTSGDNTIKTFDFDKNYDFIELPIKKLGVFTWQFRLLDKILMKEFSACILLGNPYFLSFWLTVPIFKLAGIKVYFWTHGWPTENEKYGKRLFRNIFFKLADGLFLYGQRAKKIGKEQGFLDEDLHVINNSLDYSLQKSIFATIRNNDKKALLQELGLCLDKKIIVCSARLIQRCRFDILLIAVKLIQERTNILIQVVLVGDGPEKTTLMELARTNKVDVIFWGACYDENILCKLYAASDLAVSPGKVGLTAMHSMAYGTPIITHSNFDNQGPEFEAIIPGITGDFYEENSVDNLVITIKNWFDKNPEKPIDNCIDQIEKCYTPDFQRTSIENVLIRDLE